MLSSIQKDLAVFTYRHFLAFSEIGHFVTSRIGGVSQGSTASLNLGFNTTDSAQVVYRNRLVLANSLGLEIDALCIPNQCHESNIGIVTRMGENYTNTDALISNRQGLCVAVLTADCVPILLYDPVHKAVGAVHCGWRGTVAMLLKKVVLAMEKEYKSDPSQMLAAIGPSIGPEKYEVGAEVIDAATKSFGKTSSLLVKNISGQLCFNLWQANNIQLLHLGVKEQNIESANICTASNNNLFYSYRAENGNTGRFASGIYLKR